MIGTRNLLSPKSALLANFTFLSMAQELKRIQPLAQKIMDQTIRRVIHDEKVPANEKVVSIFEAT